MSFRADAEQLDAITKTIKETLSGMSHTLPDNVEVITIVRKNYAEDYDAAVFHGTVLATKDYVLTAPARWHSDWCKLTYEESLNSTTVGGVYQASSENAHIIDSAYQTSTIKAQRDKLREEREAKR